MNIRKIFLLYRINNGEKLMIKDIYGWCQKQQVPLRMRFIYRKDFSIMVNLWNLYSYYQFEHEIREE